MRSALHEDKFPANRDTSGLPNILGLIFEKFDRSRFFTNDDVVDLLSIHRPQISFSAGAKFEYSNLGYQLLAGVIEKGSILHCDIVSINVTWYVDAVEPNLFHAS